MSKLLIQSELDRKKEGERERETEKERPFKYILNTFKLPIYSHYQYIQTVNVFRLSANSEYHHIQVLIYIRLSTHSDYYYIQTETAYIFIITTFNIFRTPIFSENTVFQTVIPGIN